MPLSLPLGPASDPATHIVAEQDAGSLVRRDILPGGVRLLTERMPAVRSATIGLWVQVGSRDEVTGEAGSTHFLEHLLFKGTPTRDALTIAEAFDRVGGEANAATAKEHTCYYARVLDADLPMALEILADMVTSAELRQSDFELERGVILDELAMSQDDPHDVVHETFAEVVFGAHPLARPIGGTPETIRAVSRDAVWNHYRERYRPGSLIVTAAGNLDHDDLAARLTAGLQAGGWGGDLRPEARPRPARPVRPTVALPAAGTSRTVERPGEQAHLIIGCEGLIATDERRHALAVLNAIIGGGMSSRLFQEIRERRGLAYSTYSFAEAHSDAGAFGLYAGCAPEVAEEVGELLNAEWDRLAADGITAAELERAQGQLSGGLVLGMEDTSSRMSRLGRAEIVTGELPTIAEMLARTAAVTAEDVHGLAVELAARPRSRVLITTG